MESKEVFFRDTFFQIIKLILLHTGMCLLFVSMDDLPIYRNHRNILESK